MMLKLYRGIVDIITDRSDSMICAFSKHIRSFNKGETEGNNFGVTGFWNLLLEVVYLTYVKLFVMFGILLTLVLAVVFFPLCAIGVAINNILNHRGAAFDEPVYIEPTANKNNV